MVSNEEIEAAKARLIGLEYLDPKYIGDGIVACIARFIYTKAIVTVRIDSVELGYEDRWCYHDYKSAKAALDDWTLDKGKEPEGWKRHPRTGRRRDKDGNEYVNQ